MKQTFKNHVAIVFDRSGSMSGLLDSAVKIFNKQIDFLRAKSLAFEQETRISFYTFDNNVECVISDVDVARPMELDKIRSGGATALLIDVANLNLPTLDRKWNKINLDYLTMKETDNIFKEIISKDLNKSNSSYSRELKISHQRIKRLKKEIQNNV
jgi:hypothetical protein